MSQTVLQDPGDYIRLWLQRREERREARLKRRQRRKEKGTIQDLPLWWKLKEYQIVQPSSSKVHVKSEPWSSSPAKVRSRIKSSPDPSAIDRSALSKDKKEKYKGTALDTLRGAMKKRDEAKKKEQATKRGSATLPSPLAPFQSKLDAPESEKVKKERKPDAFDPDKACFHCKGVLNSGDKVLEAMGRKFHIACFKCVGCDCPLASEQFYSVKEGDEKVPCCSACYLLLYATKCQKCKKATSGTPAVQLLGNYWHKTCLSCDWCGKSLDDQKIYASNEKMPLCRQCKLKEVEGASKPESEQETEEMKKEKLKALHKMNNDLTAEEKAIITTKEKPTYKKQVSETGFSAWMGQAELSSLTFPENAPGAKKAVRKSKMLSRGTVDTWQTELGSQKIDENDSKELYVDIERRFYGEYLARSEHSIFFFPKMKEDDPRILAIENLPMRQNKKGEFIYRAVMMTIKGDERFYVTIPDPSDKKQRIRAIRTAHPDLQEAQLVQAGMTPELLRELVSLEKKLLNYNFKFGVLLARHGQTTENEFYNNIEGHPEMYEFLDSIAEKVEMDGFPGYTGGLSEKGATGKYSYTCVQFMEKFDIMFHVSTLIPAGEDKVQQVGRKRHLGNDVVLIIFKPFAETPEHEGEDQLTDDAFDPSQITSHFNHVFVVVQPVSKRPNTKYRVGICYKPGVKPSKPFLPYPAIFEKGDNFRDFLLTKLINAQLAALNSPEFQTAMKRTRRLIFQEVYDAYFTSTRKRHTLPKM